MLNVLVRAPGLGFHREWGLAVVDLEGLRFWWQARYRILRDVGFAEV